MLGAVVCVLVALFTSIGAGIGVAVYFIVYQRFENYVILPRVMNKAIDLSAPTVIITLLIGSGLAGIAVALIALPIVATLKVVIREIWPRASMAATSRERTPGCVGATRVVLNEGPHASFVFLQAGRIAATWVERLPGALSMPSTRWQSATRPIRRRWRASQEARGPIAGR